MGKLAQDYMLTTQARRLSARDVWLSTQEWKPFTQVGELSAQAADVSTQADKLSTQEESYLCKRLIYSHEQVKHPHN